eukprot:c34223_g1_i1 orf=233-511(+)
MHYVSMVLHVLFLGLKGVCKLKYELSIKPVILHQCFPLHHWSCVPFACYSVWQSATGKCSNLDSHLTSMSSTKKLQGFHDRAVSCLQFHIRR